MVMRKTKIIMYTRSCTTNNEEKIRQLMLNGMDVARMNFPMVIMHPILQH